MQYRTSNKSSRFKLIKEYPTIFNPTLRAEIERRKIPFDLANKYLKQMTVFDRKSQRASVAFGFKNSNNGWVIGIPNATKESCYRHYITNKSLTIIEGMEVDRVEVFSSFWDYLTWLTMLKDEYPKYTCYILNWRESYKDVVRMIENRRTLKSVIDFLDNDRDGDEIRQYLADACETQDIPHGSQNYIYRNYKDLSEYWMKDDAARDNWPIKKAEPKIYSDTAWDMIMNIAKSKEPKDKYTSID